MVFILLQWLTAVYQIPANMEAPVKPKKEDLFAPALLATEEYYAMVNMQPPFFLMIFSKFSLKERLKSAGVYESFFLNVCFVKTEKAIFLWPVKIS